MQFIRSLLGHSPLKFLAVAALAVALPNIARAEAWLVIEADSGRVLQADNATMPWYPASVTKIMFRGDIRTYATDGMAREVATRAIARGADGRIDPGLLEFLYMRLVGTTKTTIASVRDRTHWNASTLTPMDPVTLGLCSQIELDFEVQRAAKEKPVPAAYGGATLLPASETTKKEPEFEPTEKERDDLNVDAVFAKLKTIGGKKQDDEEE